MQVGRVYPSDRAGKKIMMLTHEEKRFMQVLRAMVTTKAKERIVAEVLHTNKKRRANFKARHNCDQCKKVGLQLLNV